MAAGQVLGLRIVEPLRDRFLPRGIALRILVENVGVLAWIPAGAMGAVLLDQVLTLAEPGVVLGVMATGFGHVAVEGQEHLVAYLFLVVDILIFGDGLADQGIGILAVPAGIRGTRPCG